MRFLTWTGVMALIVGLTILLGVWIAPHLNVPFGIPEQRAVVVGPSKIPPPEISPPVTMALIPYDLYTHGRFQVTWCYSGRKMHILEARAYRCLADAALEVIAMDGTSYLLGGDGLSYSVKEERP